MEKHLARLGNEKNAFVLAISIIFRVDRIGIAVTEVDQLALLRRNARGQRDPRPAFFDAVLICADAANVSGVGQCAPRIALIFVPLLKKVIEAVVADRLDDVPGPGLAPPQAISG